MWTEKLKNGKIKCCERYTDYMTGKEKKVSVTVSDGKRKTLKAAEETLKKKIEEKQTAPPEVKEITFGELKDLYLEYQKTAVKESTYANLENKYDKVTSILGKDVICGKLTGGYIDQKIKRYSSKPSTRNYYIKAVKTILRWAYRKGYVADVSCISRLEFVKERPAREKIQDKFLEPEELTALIDALPDERHRLTTRFMALSGLRFGELSALERKDVDFEENVIHITKTYNAVVHETMDTPKTYSSERDVFIQPELRKVCRDIITFTRLDGMAHGYRTDLFLPSVHGANLSIRTYNNYLESHTPKAIKKHITSHTLRHTHCSLLAAQGVSLDTISRRLGHESDDITRKIYLHVTKKLRERDNAQLEKVQLL